MADLITVRSSPTTVPKKSRHHVIDRLLAVAFRVFSLAITIWHRDDLQYTVIVNIVAPT